ncbi:hypothetical protein COLO4_32143 [Corchorus olitorius]|uniref:Uncharacterized protein n=1 Tax=Corchorus olitorius TaxID=93759 RepID=A0A1R3H0Y4_9ROSI|nr:hypothetical protein COLO4_32143 [Corchorus olitorius]
MTVNCWGAISLGKSDQENEGLLQEVAQGLIEGSGVGPEKGKWRRA